jgi:hypothetical protein
MIKRIYKYPLTVINPQTITMPEGAEILAVQVQYDNPCLWALVNPERPDTDYIVETFGTGQPIYCDIGVERRHLGTYQVHDGDLVFHVFERLQ